jgi:hypothetical protein
MAFLKLPLEKAYATGGLRTNLDTPHLVEKLKRSGLKAEAKGSQLTITCGDEEFVFAEWERDGVGRIGWLQMKLLGDVSVLSRQLSEAGIRHRFDYSRPRDLTTNDVRCVTQYDYRWDQPGLPPRSATRPYVITFDEQL